jgi:NAD(P)-dependent dehydrogenase (short-subunit alcohol dehydrogenase family)
MALSLSDLRGIKAFDLTGKVAVVTGAGRGLGRGVALGLASVGARLVLASRDRANVERTASEIRDAGGTVVTLSADISQAQDCDALIRAAEAQFARVDIVVCNAATNILGPAQEMAEENWHKVVGTELSGYFFMAQAAFRPMSQQREGSIIMISANSSIVGYLNLSGVATAKGGVDSLVRNLAVEWGRYGIRVNTINPGWTEHVPDDGADVPAGEGDLEEDIRMMTPLRRRGRVEEFAYPVIFLASDASSYVTGHNLIVDGGYCIK